MTPASEAVAVKPPVDALASYAKSGRLQAWADSSSEDDGDDRALRALASLKLDKAQQVKDFAASTPGTLEHRQAARKLRFQKPADLQQDRAKPSRAEGITKRDVLSSANPTTAHW